MQVVIVIPFAARFWSWSFLGGVEVRFLRILRAGVRFFIGLWNLTLEVQLNYFSHHIPKLRILTHACCNGAMPFETFIETAISCYAPW